MDIESRSHPAGETTERVVTLREDEDERVWVNWFVKNVGGSFTTIYSERDGDEARILSLQSRELSQMLLALDPGEDIHMVRDMGAFERAYTERSDGFVTVTVEELGAVDRVLVLDESEAETLSKAIERAEAELPGTEDEPHV
jgi:hypothetical protein